MARRRRGGGGGGTGGAAGTPAATAAAGTPGAATAAAPATPAPPAAPATQATPPINYKKRLKVALWLVLAAVAVHVFFIGPPRWWHWYSNNEETYETQAGKRYTLINREQVGPHTVTETVTTEWYAPVLPGPTYVDNVHSLTEGVIIQRRINADNAQIRDLLPGVNERMETVMHSFEWRLKPGQGLRSVKTAHDEWPMVLR